jgi:hypothetical protein
MRSMKNIRLRGVAAALAAAAVAAQPLAQQLAASRVEARGIAELREVHGNVLVSGDTGLASGGEKLRLEKGTRVITTANATVVVAYDNGCDVKLKENQRFEVDDEKPCTALVAQPQSILATPEGAAAAGGAAGALGYFASLPVLSGAGIAIVPFLRSRESVSPN